MLPSHLYSDVTRVARILKIITRLRQRQPTEQLGRRVLADEFGCDPRTIQRDIELLQVFMHLPLTYDRALKTYLLEPQDDTRLSLSLTVEETLALALARGLLATPGFPLKDVVLATLDKVVFHLPVAVQDILSQSEQTFHADALARDYSQAPLAPLIEAARAGQTLELFYKSRSSKQLTWRCVDPYEVTLRSGQFWELHGWCHTRQAIRTFALDKIEQVRPTSTLFTRHEQEWTEFQAAGGVLSGLRGEASITVDVIFDACVADYALDRQWPKTLRLCVLPDGSVQMTGIAQGTDGLLVELLSWRRHVLVKGGPELRARIKAEVQAIAARYKEDDCKMKDCCEKEADEFPKNNSSVE